MDEDELNELFLVADITGQGVIDYEEFIAAMLDSQRVAQCVGAVRSSFEQLDRDGDGYISVQDLAQVCVTEPSSSHARRVCSMLSSRAGFWTYPRSIWMFFGASVVGAQARCKMLPATQHMHSLELLPRAWCCVKLKLTGRTVSCDHAVALAAGAAGWSSVTQGPSRPPLQLEDGGGTGGRGGSRQRRHGVV